MQETRTRKTPRNKTGYLNSLLQNKRDFQVEFRPFQGWYVDGGDPRYFGDNGDYLGKDWRQAIYWLGRYGYTK